MRTTLAVAAALLACLSGCGKHKATPAPWPRIITLAPHITTIAFDMGLGDHVVGVDGFSRLPPGQSRTVVGDAQGVNSEAILVEEPHVIFHNQSADFSIIQRARPAVRIVRVRNDTIQDVREGILAIGQETGRADLAERMLKGIDERLSAIQRRSAGPDKPRVAFVLGTDSPVLAGGGTYIDELIRLAGGLNVAGEMRQWAQANAEAVLELRPQVIIVWAAGEDQAQAAAQYWRQWQQRARPEPDRPDAPAQPARVQAASDPCLISASSRIADAAELIAAMIHPQTALAEPPIAEGAGETRP